MRVPFHLIFELLMLLFLLLTLLMLLIVFGVSPLFRDFFSTRSASFVNMSGRLESLRVSLEVFQVGDDDSS